MLNALGQDVFGSWMWTESLGDGMKFLAPTLNELNGIFDAQLLQCFLIICDNVSRKITKRANEMDFIM